MWYIYKEGSFFGPYSADDIHAKMKERSIEGATYILKENESAAKRIVDVSDFKQYFESAPSGELIQKHWNSLKAKPASDEVKEWFVVLNGSAEGPFSVPEISQRFRLKQITASSFIWKQGMENWDLIANLEPFKELMRSQVAPAPGVPTPPAPVASSPAEVPASERRSSPRKPLVASVLIANDQGVMKAVCQDVSDGGMLLLSDAGDLKVGDMIKMNISPGDNPSMTSFTAEAKVTRVLPDGRGFSVRFLALKEDARKRILEYISST